MESKALEIKLALTAFFGAAGELLGWKGVMLLILVAFMAMDYLSGSMAARKDGTWSSKIAREGLFHKTGVILAVIVALLADLMFMFAIPVIPLFGGVRNPGAFLPLVLAWYILTEAGSVLENVAKMGAKVPAWFEKAIRSTGSAVDKAGEAQTPEEGEDKHE